MTATAPMAIIAADLANIAPGFADKVRQAVADAIDTEPARVLLNSSHTHAAPWPGAGLKLGGETDDWTALELALLGHRSRPPSPAVARMAAGCSPRGPRQRRGRSCSGLGCQPA